jgi:hypothetical protein
MPGTSKKTESNLPDDEIRYTVIAKKEDINKVLDLAYTERISIKEAFSRVIDKYFEDYDGEIIPSPKRK